MSACEGARCAVLACLTATSVWGMLACCPIVLWVYTSDGHLHSQKLC